LNPRRLLGVTLLVAGLWFVGAGGYVHAKAWLAQELMQRSWERTLHGERNVRPWPDADFWPVARLRIPSRGVDLYVLSEASGRALAFGPGHVASTAPPGTTGHTVIAGHRDTHFAALESVRVGDFIDLELPSGKEVRYRIVKREVIDTRTEPAFALRGEGLLTLVTCFPFHSSTGDRSSRLLVDAELTSQRIAQSRS